MILRGRGIFLGAVDRNYHKWVISLAESYIDGIISGNSRGMLHKHHGNKVKLFNTFSVDSYLAVLHYSWAFRALAPPQDWDPMAEIHLLIL